MSCVEDSGIDSPQAVTANQPSFPLILVTERESSVLVNALLLGRQVLPF